MVIESSRDLARAYSIRERASAVEAGSEGEGGEGPQISSALTSRALRSTLISSPRCSDCRAREVRRSLASPSSSRS